MMSVSFSKPKTFIDSGLNILAKLCKFKLLRFSIFFYKNIKEPHIWNFEKRIL